MVRLLVLIALIFSFSACSDGDSEDHKAAISMESYQQQTLQWSTCDQSIVINAGLKAALEDRLQCTEMRVPMDYENPDRGDLKVALMRVVSSNPSARKGSLFLNPGGPGEDGYYQGAALAMQLSAGNPDVSLGKAYLDLLDAYDLIGFSPRGTGNSTILTCGDDRWIESIFDNDRDNRQNSSDRQLHFARIRAEACQRNPLTRYINTEQTVQDLELARQLVGDTHLNMIGYSYGTWLATWYAGKYPQNVGRIVLDSSMDFSADFDAAKINTQKGTQAIFDILYAPYAAKYASHFQIGGTAQEVLSTFDALDHYMRQLLRGLSNEIAIGRDFWKDNFCIPERLSNYGATQGCQAELKKIDFFLESLHVAAKLESLFDLYPSDLASVSEQIRNYVFFDDPIKTETSRAVGLWLIHEFELAALNQERLFNQWNWQSSVFSAVTCNDMPTEKDPYFWIALGDKFALELPLAGGHITQNECLFWERDTNQKQKPPIENILQANLMPLMVQSAHDMQTPLEGARNAANALNNQPGFITVEYESKHGLFPYETECVDLPIIHYLLNDTFAGNVTCIGKPFLYFGDDTLTDQDIQTATTLDNLYLHSEQAATAKKMYQQLLE